MLTVTPTDELRSRGFNVLPGETAIVPVVIQQELDLCRLCDELHGLAVNHREAGAQGLVSADDLVEGLL